MVCANEWTTMVILCWDQPDIWNLICQSYVTLSVTVLKFKISYNHIWCHIWTAKNETKFSTKTLSKKKKLSLTTKMVWSSVCSELKRLFWEVLYYCGSMMKGAFCSIKRKSLDFGLYREREWKKSRSFIERWLISNLSQDRTITTQDLFHSII